MGLKQKETKGKKEVKKKSKTDSNVDIGKDIGRKERKTKRAVIESEEVAEKVTTKKTKIGSFVIKDLPDLPKVDTDPELQKIAENSNKVEKAAKKKKESKQNKSDKESYLSVSTAAKDGEVPKVPAFSSPKNRGVVYISHIPHGFYEKQMREFFSQFGSVTNLRLGRSRNTGKSRGYAFVEFKFHEVATIVAESMNNYLMFDKILKCSVVPQEKVSQAMFAGKIKPSRPPGKTRRAMVKKLHNSVKDEATTAKRRSKQIEKVNATMKKLKDAGIDYDFQIAEMSQ